MNKIINLEKIFRDYIEHGILTNPQIFELKSFDHDEIRKMANEESGSEIDFQCFYINRIARWKGFHYDLTWKIYFHKKSYVSNGLDIAPRLRVTTFIRNFLREKLKYLVELGQVKLFFSDDYNIGVLYIKNYLKIHMMKFGQKGFVNYKLTKIESRHNILSKELFSDADLYEENGLYKIANIGAKNMPASAKILTDLLRC